MKIEEEIDREMEEAAVKSALNFGEPMDMWHPNYGWILKNGKPTEVGMEWYKTRS